MTSANESHTRVRDAVPGDAAAIVRFQILMAKETEDVDLDQRPILEWEPILGVLVLEPNRTASHFPAIIANRCIMSAYSRAARLDT